jgi:hypothetical protein
MVKLFGPQQIVIKNNNSGKPTSKKTKTAYIESGSKGANYKTRSASQNPNESHNSSIRHHTP